MNLAQMAHLSQLIACIGVIPAMWGIFDATEKARIEEQKSQALLRLTAFPALDGVIQRDREERENIDRATSDLGRLARNGSLSTAFSSGRAAYHGIEGLASVGRHYEYLGVMVRLGYVEFEPIFEVISFPDDLWEEMESSGLLTLIRESNWSGEGKPLPDFWVNFEYLKRCYNAARSGEDLPGHDPAEAAPSSWTGRVVRALRGE